MNLSGIDPATWATFVIALFTGVAALAAWSSARANKRMTEAQVHMQLMDRYSEHEMIFSPLLPFLERLHRVGLIVFGFLCVERVGPPYRPFLDRVTVKAIHKRLRQLTHFYWVGFWLDQRWAADGLSSRSDSAIIRSRNRSRSRDTSQ